MIDASKQKARPQNRDGLFLTRPSWILGGRDTGAEGHEGHARVGRDMYAAANKLAADERITLAEWVRNALIGRILQGKAAQQGLMIPLIDRKFHQTE